MSKQLIQIQILGLHMTLSLKLSVMAVFLVGIL
jgi:hypothetical protein